MTTLPTMTLTEFFLARLDEREAAVCNCNGADEGHREHCAALEGDLLADCAAKRQIVQAFHAREAQGYDDPTGVIHAHATGLRLALKYLAQVYWDHADFREEWAL